MSGSVSSKKPSLWPKLLLGGAIVLAGLLYLGYVDKGVTVSKKPETVDHANEPDAAPVADAVPTEGKDAAGAPMTPDVVKQTSGEQPTVEDSAPVVVGTQEALSPEVPVTGEPELQDASALESATSIAETPSAAPAEVPAEVTPEEAKAFAEAVISEGETQQEATGGDTGAPAVPDSASAVPEATAAPSESVDAPAESGVAGLAVPPALPPPPGWPPVAAPPRRPARETLEERRSRLIADYEAMRKQAEEEMRRRWGQGRMPGPYGYPGYAPGYYPRP